MPLCVCVRARVRGVQVYFKVTECNNVISQNTKVYHHKMFQLMKEVNVPL